MNPFLSAAGTLAKGSAVGAAALVGGTARAAGMMGLASWQVGSSLIKGLGGGNYTEMKGIGMGKVKLPHLRGGIQAGLGIAAFGGMLAAGAYQATAPRRWTPNSSMEVEREDFLGATGSLTLGMANRSPQSSLVPFHRTALVHASDDVARLFLR